MEPYSHTINKDFDDNPVRPNIKEGIMLEQKNVEFINIPTDIGFMKPCEVVPCRNCKAAPTYQKVDKGPSLKSDANIERHRIFCEKCTKQSSSGSGRLVVVGVAVVAPVDMWTVEGAIIYWNRMNEQ